MRPFLPVFAARSSARARVATTKSLYYCLLKTELRISISQYFHYLARRTQAISSSMHTARATEIQIDQSEFNEREKLCPKSPQLFAIKGPENHLKDSSNWVASERTSDTSTVLRLLFVLFQTISV